MTTYNTGNALGSTDARDLYDNAENLENLVNGAALAYSDRRGVSRKSWAGIESDFQSFLLSSGYEFLGDYDDGIVITSFNQVVRESGEFWRLGAGATLPYTTTGTWATDDEDFVAVGDATLRQDLGDALHKAVFDTLEDFRASSADVETVEILAANAGTTTGRMILKATGTSAGTPTLTAARFTALAGGEIINEGGYGYALAESTEINVSEMGAITNDDASAAANSTALQNTITAATFGEVVSSDPVRVLTGTLVDVFGNGGYNYYAASVIAQSDLYFGAGEYHAEGRDVAGTYVEPILATERNTVAGTLARITFDGTRFDVSDDGNINSSNQRALYLTCVDNLRLLGTFGYTSGSRRGYFAHLHNVRNVIINGHTHDSITGGINFRHASGVSLTGSVFYDFSEAIDFDGIADTVSISGLTFRSSTSELDDQCIDMNSMVNCAVTGIAANGVGNIYTINYKDTTQETYQEYLDNDTPVNLTPSRNVVVSNVVGFQAGKSTVPSVIVGTDFSSEPTEGAVKRLILTNHVIESGGYVQVTGCEDLTLSNWILKDISSPASYSFGAITLRPDTVSTGTNLPVEATLINVDINGCNRSALAVAGCRRLDIDGLRVRNADTSASGDYEVSITSVPSAAKYTIDRLDVTGDVRISAPSDAQIFWGDRNRVSGSIILQDSAHTAIEGEYVPLFFGDVAATGTVNMRWTAKRKCKVISAFINVASAVPADGSNYRTVQSQSVVSGATTTIASPTTIAGWSANTMIDGGFTVNETAVDLARGDSIVVNLLSTGTGQALTDAQVMLNVMWL